MQRHLSASDRSHSIFFPREYPHHERERRLQVDVLLPLSLARSIGGIDFSSVSLLEEIIEREQHVPLSFLIPVDL